MEDSPRQGVRSAVRRLLLTDAVAIAAMLILSAWAWTRIPPDKLIAVHWGAAGQPNGFVGKTAGLLWMPVVAVFVSAIMLAFLLIPKFEAVRSMKAYVAVATAVLAVLLGLHVMAVLAAVGQKFNMPAMVLTITGIMLIVIGNYFTKMRRNRWMGVRTPWTRASDSVWDKTHRLASRLFIGLGLLLIVMAWTGLDMILQGTIMLTGILGVTLAVYIYSYIVWRLEKRSPLAGS